jgi:general L-amino acid transport system permease protein
MTDGVAVSGPAPRTAIEAFRRWWGDRPVAQALILAAAAALLALLGANILMSMRRLGMSPTLDYLWQPANFDISESLIVFKAGDPYWRAILVGVLNTLKLAFFGCALSTVLGVTLGVARVSGNPLLSGLVQAYVELIRNTPLTLQLFFWIAATRALPAARQALQPLPGAFLSVRGVFLPWLRIEGGDVWPLILVLAILAIAIGVMLRHLERPMPAPAFVCLLALFPLVGAIWMRAFGITLRLDIPSLKGFNITGGISLTPEFAAMLIGLTVYYAASISEIVRSGLQSVSKGQWEAGHALGLASLRILRLVVIPQAMRVITPLMTSSYLDLTKDTTLGVLIGFTEVTAIIKTSANNTGNAVETIIVLVAVFLSISLPVSALINAYNRSLARRGMFAA